MPTRKTSSSRTASPQNRVTLKTIAEVTGLSLSTVSLSLRHGSKLKQETRDKVAQAAKDLGYIPDRAGVRLRTGKTNVIALVLDSKEDSIDFARQMIQGIGQAMKGTRYHLTVIPEFESDNSDETVRYVLANRTADGVILTHTLPRDRRVQLLMDAEFPFITHGRTEFYTPHPFHDFDAQEFTRMAVQRLLEKGCQSLHLTIGDDRTTYFHSIQTAFLQAAAKAGVEAQVMDAKMGHDPAESRAIGSALSQSGKRPIGIICDSEMRTIALVAGLQASGAVMGRDFHVVYKQTSGIVPAYFPTMDSIQEDVFDAGVELTRLLLERIAGTPAADLQTLAAPTPKWRSGD